MGKVNVYINNFIRKDGYSALYMRIYLNNKELRFNLHIEVENNKFDRSTQRLVGRSNIVRQKNMMISRAVGLADDIILRYEVNKKKLTHEIFLKEFHNPDSFKSFYKFMEEQIKRRRGEITEGSEKQHFSVLNSLKEYKKELLISEFDDNYLIGYRKFLRAKGLKKNTIHHKLKVLKTYTNKCIQAELLSKNPFTYFSFGKEKTYRVFLTDDELNKLIELYKSEYLLDYKKIIRHFLFACFTGVRISDFKELRFNNLKDNKLIFHPVKSRNIDRKRIVIPLGRMAKQLIKDENKLKQTGLLFDSYTEQTINRKLKEIADFLKIDKKITFHSARHTFATRFLKKQKRSDAVLILQDLMGHSNLSTTSQYLHVIEDDKEEAMALFDN